MAGWAESAFIPDCLQNVVHACFSFVTSSFTLPLCRCWCYWDITWGATSSQQDSVAGDHTSSAYTRFSVGGFCDEVSGKCPSGGADPLVSPSANTWSSSEAYSFGRVHWDEGPPVRQCGTPRTARVHPGAPNKCSDTSWSPSSCERGSINHLMGILLPRICSCENQWRTNTWPYYILPSHNLRGPEAWRARMARVRIELRAQAAIDSTLCWNGLLPDLQATTMLGQWAGGGSFCSLCRGVDHSTFQCALGPLQQPVVSHQAGMSGNMSTSSGSGRRDHPWFWPVCLSWNGGHCTYPGRCTFRHVSITCGQRHQARDCRDTPQDSPYKRGLQPQAPFNSGSSTGR